MVMRTKEKTLYQEHGEMSFLQLSGYAARANPKSRHASSSNRDSDADFIKAGPIMIVGSGATAIFTSSTEDFEVCCFIPEKHGCQYHRSTAFPNYNAQMSPDQGPSE